MYVDICLSDVHKISQFSQDWSLQLKKSEDI